MPGRAVRRLLPTALARLALLVATAALAGCAPPAQAPPTPTVSVASAISREVADWDEFNGRFVAVEEVALRPRVGGYIERVAFVEGGLVARGDLLFVIDPRPFAAEVRRQESELARQRAALALAQDQLRRARTLRTAAAISQDELDRFASTALQAAAAVGASAAALDSARLELGFTEIRAPIAGRIGRAEVTASNLVQAGQGATLLATLVSVDPIHVDFDGDEHVYLRHAALSRRGDGRDAAATLPVFAGLATDTGFPHRGELTFVDNQLDRATGTIRMRARFANRDGLFTPGLFARIKVAGARAAPAVLVDAKAIGTDQDLRFVLVLGAGDVLQYRRVTPGRTIDGLRIITSGLAAGETIVVNGLQRVRPGVKVIAERVPMTGAQRVPMAGAQTAAAAKPAG
jgi:RND family efflux transporter MFP subunit